MSKYENKICPRCKQIFECKVGNITQCHCYGINLGEEENQIIEKIYNDCLCNNCLLDLKNEFALQTGNITFTKK